MCFTLSNFSSFYRGRGVWRLHPGIFAIFAAFALGATVSPSCAIPRASMVLLVTRQLWYYWCSMMLGASPFLTAGAFIATLASSISKRWSAPALVTASLILPGCDCTINGSCSELARLPAPLAAFTVTFGTCCNPLALASTYLILGRHMALCRLLCGLCASAITACAWLRGCAVGAMCPTTLQDSFSKRFVSAMNGALAAFSLASAAACSALVLLMPHLTRAPLLVAAMLGALLSPCSSSDSLLARVLFSSAKNQLIFIMAAQCLDIRQAMMLRRHFGLRRTLMAFASSASACALGYVIA
jgi:uncharacterized membrane protein YraQ (UPF0718 family)